MEKYKVLSLFSGLGGFDMGFEGDVVVHKDSVNDLLSTRESSHEDFVLLQPHNFDIVFQNDILEGAKEIFSLNNPTKNKDNYVTRSIYDLLNENYNFPKADVVIGGFPCQDFSHCGKRTGFESNKAHDLKSKVNSSKSNNRGTLYKSFVEVVKRVKPKIFVAENVYGLLTMEGEPIKQIVSDFQDLGYQVKYQDIYCPNFGIPQTRRRVIIMGINTKMLQDTEKLPSNWNEIEKNKGVTCSIGKYFKHLKEPDETTDISQMMYSKAKKLEKGQGQTQINPESFAPTMRAEHHGNIEFRRHETPDGLPERRLTIREAGLIQTFSPDYIFTTKKNQKAYKFIGNAVPPLLAYLVADKVTDLLIAHF